MANSRSTDFLRFNAYSIKDLITRKLSQDTNFTDQIYEGSNLAILIDLVSYMYQCLLIQLNNAASESMFADTQIYENICRLVSLIGYQPKGCYPASFNGCIELVDDQHSSNLVCLPYTRINTGLTDSNGKTIYFSTKHYTEEDNIDNRFENGEILDQVFFNGQYKLYSTIFTASGIPNETFILDGIMSDSSDAVRKYVAHNFIDVYVLDSKGDVDRYWHCDIDGIFTRSKNIQDIYTSNSGLYSSTDDGTNKVYTVNLNEDKTYELKFGDGIVGRKLGAGDRVVVFYLDTNGPDGKIDIANVDFSSLKLEHNAQMFGMNESLYKQVFNLNGTNAENVAELDPSQYVIKLNNYTVNDFIEEQSPETVRENAPSWFKTGNRLITAADYEYFIKNHKNVRDALGTVIDVKCMNNTEYVATFYKWLYMQGLDYFRDGKHYFNQSFWSRSEYQAVDPADANNTYLWIKIDNRIADKYKDTYSIVAATDTLTKLLNPLKTMTTELQVVKPVIVAFDICANNDFDSIRANYISDTKNFDEECETYIEVSLDDNTLYVSSSIQEQVYKKIVSAFSTDKCRLGQNINYSSILDDIYTIPGIRQIRTVYKNPNGGTRIYDGLSFASWSPILDDSQNEQHFVGVDLNVSNSNRTLEPFQFPRFIGATLLKKRIRVIKKVLTVINTIKQ